jgi:serine/threonine-protein kinase
MTGTPPTAGARLDGFLLKREVGRGASGIVYEALGPDDTLYALKVLVPPVLLAEPDRAALLARFSREARALSAVRHPHVVHIAQVGVADGHAYIAMEFLAGENLRDLISRAGPVGAAEAVAIGLQLCAALDAVHAAGIVHRDVKPENVLLLPDGTIRLTDFGIARMEDEATLTRTGGILGSPAYMAPEQILGRPVDARSDLFSASATLYQLVAGALPFAGASLVELAHNVAYAEPADLPASVPVPLAAVLRRGLARVPADRFPSARSLASALEATLEPSGAAPLHMPTSPDGAERPPTPRSAAPTASHTLAVSADASEVDSHRDGLGHCRPVAVPATPCHRHRRQPSVGRCRGCGRPVCRYCVRESRPPFYCPLHRPLTVLGVQLVRVEVALVALAFLILLLCLSPLGYSIWRTEPGPAGRGLSRPLGE